MTNDRNRGVAYAGDERPQRRPASFWHGACAQCRAITDLAYRPGTSLKVCARCMWPKDFEDQATDR